MQNRGAIIFLVIAFALVSLYQLSFTLVTNNVKADAKEYAQGDPQKEQNYLDSLANRPVYNLGFKNYTLNECMSSELNLGLDLKGGMNVMLEVSVTDLIRNMADYSTDTTFNRALKQANLDLRDSQDDYVTLFGKAFSKIDPNAKLAAIFSTYELKEKITVNSTNDEVLAVIRAEAQAAIDNSFNILRTRIDRFGVSQPNIQRIGLESSGRILVELPGVKDPARVKKLLQGTANLEFWETYDNNEVYKYLEQANNKLGEIEKIKVALKDTVAVVENNTTAAVADTTKQTDSTELAIIDQLSKDTTNTNNAFEEFSKSNPLFAVLSPAANQQGQLIQGAMVGSALVKDTAKVFWYLRQPQVQEFFPRNLKFYWEVKPFNDTKGNSYYNLVAIKVNNREGLAALSGEAISDARAEFGDNDSRARVSMTMNGEGSKTWARLTRENIGKQIAVVLDNYVYTYPTVQNEIKGGSSEITGNFSIQEAQDLANILKSGKMPAPARIIQEEVVGPTLGQESINAGLGSFIIAFIVVLIYMVFYYNKAGWAANISLLFNVFFIFGVLASIGLTLTLPGIAGIVLTMGMAVDANVLIYERIREELHAGKGLRLAIQDGFNNAYSAIIDGNVTTFLTGVVLFLFGTGPIKGFATTLNIGIITTLFTAIFISRIIFSWWLDGNKSISFSTKFTDNAFKNLKINFLGQRKYAYIFSITLTIISVVSIATRGFNLGVDFTGGRNFVIQFDEPVTTKAVAEAMNVGFGEKPLVVTFGENKVKITSKYRYEENGNEVDADINQKLYTSLKPLIKKDVSIDEFNATYKIKSDVVGPAIADDITAAAITAIIIALFIIFLYIVIRFRNWQYGLGGVISLAHDAIIVLGFYSVFYSIMPFSLEIDQAFIAAILTVIGYSINDTVIIYDRIRENLNLHKRSSKFDNYNHSLNSTLSRTFSTTFTTLIVLVAIFIFGGDVIRGFIFAMLLGIFFGTYSSLYVATPIAYDTLKKFDKEPELAKK